MRTITNGEDVETLEPTYITDRNIKYYSSLYVNILSNIMRNSQKVKTTPKFIKWWRDKQDGIATQGNVTHLWKEMKY